MGSYRSVIARRPAGAGRRSLPAALFGGQPPIKQEPIIEQSSWASGLCERRNSDAAIAPAKIVSCRAKAMTESQPRAWWIKKLNPRRTMYRGSIGVDTNICLCYIFAMPDSSTDIIPIAELIFVIRGHKVMIDSDLAKLYEIETFNLNKAVQRNLNRFPSDFMFRLTSDEAKSLTFQNGISKGRGGRRHIPYVFTEQGVAMLSSVLRSERAVEVNIAIMRAFVQLRRMLLTNKELAQRLDEMEQKYDKQIKTIVTAINQLMLEEPKTKRTIGFK